MPDQHTPIRPGLGSSCRLWTRPSGVGTGRSTLQWFGTSMSFPRPRVRHRKRSKLTIRMSPSKHFNIGVEYYSSYGQWGNFVSLHYQQQQVFPVVNLFVSPKWEINFGAGWGATAGTDHLIVKCIIGRYFDWSHHRPGSSDSAP